MPVAATSRLRLMQGGHPSLLAMAIFCIITLGAYAEPSMAAYPSLAGILSPALLTQGKTPVLGVPIKINGRGADPVLLVPPPRTSKSPEPKPPLRIEILTVLPWAEENRSADPKILFEKLAVLGAQAGSLEGLEYWSASRKKMRLLYQKAYRIRKPEAPSPLPDPRAMSELGKGPPWVLYALLEDLTFGSNIYQFSLSPISGYDGLKVSMANVHGVKYGFLPLAKPGDMASDISVIPCDEGIAVHFLTRLAAPELLAQRAFESAGNKALAVMGWFVEKLGEAGIGSAVAMPHDIAGIANP
ncbi:MAG: hypothetical protein FD137_2048 [Spirochaetes bacterium]|nr:MAG: hypothetical protein FD137_2048 [Spirochaetota bacterium]